MSALEVGTRLVELCIADKGEQAVDELYALDIVSVEAMEGSPEMPQEIRGVDGVRAKSEWWYANNEVHGFSAEGPWPHGDRFVVKFELDITSKTGSMAGQRVQMSEVGLYTVKDGKIAREEFFYAM